MCGAPRYVGSPHTAPTTLASLVSERSLLNASWPAINNVFVKPKTLTPPLVTLTCVAIALPVPCRPGRLGRLGRREGEEWKGKMR